MFVSERVVFMELHKAGCIHIRNVLRDLLEGRLLEKHGMATPELFNGTRAFLGSIRDPWEWYISLWAYGCDSRGAVFKQVMRPTSLRFRGLGWRTNPRVAAQTLLSACARHFTKPRAHREWKKTYQSVDDASASPTSTESSPRHL